MSKSQVNNRNEREKKRNIRAIYVGVVGCCPNKMIYTAWHQNDCNSLNASQFIYALWHQLCVWAIQVQVTLWLKLNFQEIIRKQLMRQHKKNVDRDGETQTRMHAAKKLDIQRTYRPWFLSLFCMMNIVLCNEMNAAKNVIYLQCGVSSVQFLMAFSCINSSFYRICVCNTLVNEWAKKKRREKNKWLGKCE